MAYKKVLLLIPPYSGTRVRLVFSAGVGYLAQSLDAAGIDYTVVNLSFGGGWRALSKAINDFDPDLLAISLMTYGFKESYALINKIKKYYPDLTIIAGGPHISLFRDEALKQCAGIDYGATMEGEETLVEFCRGNFPDLIKGLLRRKAGAVLYSGDRPFIKDLDGIPFPRYAKFDMEKTFGKNRALPVISSRGCPFECVYCPVRCSIGQAFRVRSAENVAGELQYWYAKGYRNFSFGDDNFSLVKERVVKICELIKQADMPGIKLSCDNGIRADKTDKELLTLMKEAGFYRIAFGVEAGNDKILANLHKAEKLAVILTAIENACALGYEVDLFFLVGSPGETLKDLDDSLKIAMRYPVGTAYFYNIIPFPNTLLFEWIKDNGRFLQSPDRYLNHYPILNVEPVFETKDMPYRERKVALRRAFAVTKLTRYRFWAGRLSRLGIVGKILAYLYSRSFTQDIILRNGFARKIIYVAANLFIR